MGLTALTEEIIRVDTGSHCDACFRCLEDAALSMTVAGDGPLVRILLVGLLDDATGESLVRLVDQLVSEGFATFEFDMTGARMLGRPGLVALHRATEAAQQAGATWSAIRRGKPGEPVHRLVVPTTVPKLLPSRP